MYRYGGYIYNHDGTDIREDPDCLDYDPENDPDDDFDDWNDDEEDEEDLFEGDLEDIFNKLMQEGD